MLAFNDAKSDLSFLIGINKPTGMTSHDVVNACRKIFGIKRIGHMGTLDPYAEGVMLLGVGSAARLNNYLETADKTYKVTAEFGKATDTYDAEGCATESREVPSSIMTENFATEYLSKLIGKHMQKPPAYSAIKVDGKPSYKAARKGEEVDLPEREIEIYEASLCEVSQNSWTFEVAVSKGTYIRSLVHDIGQDLGCGAFVRSLERTAVGSVTLEDCYKLEDFAEAFPKGNYNVLDATKLLGFPVVEADEKMMKRVKNGNSLRNNSEWNLFPGAKLSVVDDNKLQAIYKMEDLHTLICECKFSSALALPKKQDYCVTLGVFDGYHEGHAYEVGECISDASRHGAKSVIITFDIDPDEIFAKDLIKLSSNSERIAKLKESGVDEVRVLDFTEVKDLSGEEFLQKEFGKNLPVSIHVGEGFKFGKNQSGNTDLLLQWGKEHGVEINVHELVKKDGEVISSTRLRKGLED